jgi:CheY-like chemotaxis protein
MADTVFYAGSEPDDFSAISAGFKQMAREVELHFAASAEELLKRLDAEGRPSVIFVGLTPEDATTVLRALKTHEKGRWIPTILIGDSPYESHGERLVSCGAVAYLQRPIQTDALHRLFSATGELMLRPQEDGALLSVAATSAPS